jgi:single-strand DNA-binding protein
MNKAILIGNLGKDPEVRTLESGTKLATFSLATSESYVDKNTGEKKTSTEWHNIVLWGGLADVAEKYLHKGDKAMVEGKITTRSYDDRGGNTVYRTEVVGRNMEMLTMREQKKEEPKPQPFPDLPEETDDLPF